MRYSFLIDYNEADFQTKDEKIKDVITLCFIEQPKSLTLPEIKENCLFEYNEDEINNIVRNNKEFLMVGYKDLVKRSFEAFIFKGVFLERLLAASRKINRSINFEELRRITHRLVGIEIKNPKIEEVIKFINKEVKVVHISKRRCYFAFYNFFPEELCVKKNQFGEYYWGFQVDKNYNFESVIETKSQKNKDRDDAILRDRYGLFGKRQTYAVLSKRCKLTRSRICQIIKTSLQKIRRNEDIKNFTFYMINQFENKTICDIKLLNDRCRQVLHSYRNNVNLVNLLRFLNDVYRRKIFIVNESGNYISLNKFGLELFNENKFKLLKSFKGILIDEFYNTFVDYLKEQGFVYLTAEEIKLLFDPIREKCQKRKADKKALIIYALRQLGKPSHYTSITKVVNLLAGEKYKPRNIHATLTLYPKIFVWVGKKGTYGLREWGISKPKPIYHLIYKIVLSEKRPMNFDEIYVKVKETRPFTPKETVQIVLSFEKKLFKLSDGQYVTIRKTARYEDKIKEKIKEEFKKSKEANQIKMFMDCVKNNKDKLKQLNPQLCEKGATYLLKKKEYSKLITLQDVLPKTKLIKGIMLAAKAKI